MSERKNDTENVEQLNEAGSLRKNINYIGRSVTHKDGRTGVVRNSHTDGSHSIKWKGAEKPTTHDWFETKNKIRLAEEVEQRNEEVEQIDEESLAASSLKPASRSVADPKSKIEAITSVIGAMHAMRKDDLTKWYSDAMALIGKEASSLPSGANADSNASSIDMKGGKGPKTRDAMPKLSVKEDVEEMFVGEELTEEFKDKATTLFEAAVNARAIVEIARLEEEYEERLEEEVTSIAEAVERNLDVYLDYVVEKWMEDNQVAIESSLRNELAEEFISGLKNLFVEHYISVPEEKVDVVESLAAKVEELEEALDETINENAELKTVIAEAERLSIIDSLSEGLTMTQSEKFFSLAEGVDFNGDLDNYKHKLEIVKNTYFTGKKSSSTNIEEETFEVDTPTQVLSSDPMVNKYVQAISRTVKK
jgi:AcrR family transcriptional regulator